MTDADGLSELVHVGLRNPARVVVKVQSKKVTRDVDGKRKIGEVVQERRIPAKYISSHPPAANELRIISIQP